ncbi:MAG TPA: cytochrome c-type biogenesis protein CcmH [Gaiellales bacterium]
MRWLVAVVLGAALVAAPPAGAAAAWSVTDLENQLMCPVCHEPLNQSQSSAADQIRSLIRAKHDQGWSEQRTKAYLIDQYGEEILAAPPHHGFGLLAWVVPGAVLLGGGAVAVALAMRWSRGRGAGPPAPPPSPDPELDERIDAELAREEA